MWVLELNSGPLEDQLLSIVPSRQFFILYFSFIHCLFISLLRFIYYVYSVLPACMLTSQKRALDLIIDGCESSCGCWELNSGPLEEQPVRLTSEPSLQPLLPFTLYTSAYTIAVW